MLQESYRCELKFFHCYFILDNYSKIISVIIDFKIRPRLMVIDLKLSITRISIVTTGTKIFFIRGYTYFIYTEL